MKLLKPLLDIVYPQFCILCQDYLLEKEKTICLPCDQSINEALGSMYWYENKSLCFTNKYALFPFNKGSISQKLIHELKYNGNVNLGIYLGQKFGYFFREQLKKVDLLVPVPLHRKKERKRGFNQSEVIARGISMIDNIPLSTNNLLRKRNATTQTKMSKEQRFQNMRNTFELANSKVFAKQNILLVDDIYTTGATSEACYREIFKGNPNSISLAVIAKAQ